MEDCIMAARELGKRIGNELDIPVFLYEEAAIRPERRRLEEIRRGWLQSLSERIKDDPAWSPDFGPNMIHPTAGATVVGARKPFIAFNVNLDTPDIKIAKKIAWRIRESCGGLPHVKAIGLFLEDKGIVQVSMNLTDYESTPPDRVFHKIEEETRSIGVGIKDSEVIGLIPEKALLMAYCDLLKLKGFKEDQILEKRIAPLLLEMEGQDLDDLLASISAATPTPGGGAVSAIAGSLGAALAAMAAGITKDKNIAGETEELKRLMEEFRGLADDDAIAYQGFISTLKIPKEDPQRKTRIEESLQKATLIPLSVADKGIKLLSIIEGIIPDVNKKTLPDLKVGILMAVCAVEGAVEYVIVNTASLSEQTFIRSCKVKTDQIKTSLNGYKERLHAL
jgi:formiminotetrahydrofolate cyclodeaminase